MIERFANRTVVGKTDKIRQAARSFSANQK
jgi:hypothetical protein